MSGPYFRPETEMLVRENKRFMETWHRLQHLSEAVEAELETGAMPALQAAYDHYGTLERCACQESTETDQAH